MKTVKIYCLVCEKMVKPKTEHNFCRIIEICPKCSSVLSEKPDDSVSIDEYMHINQID